MRVNREVTLPKTTFILLISGLYAVINNAGVCVCGEFEWLTWGQICSQVEVGVNSLIHSLIDNSIHFYHNFDH